MSGERAAFAKRALDYLRTERPDLSATLDEATFSIATASGDGASSTVNLHNFFEELRHAADPAAEATIFARLASIAGLVDGKETLDEIRVLLRPRIRPRRFFELDSGTPTPCYYRPLGDYLGVGIAIDRPQLIEYVNDPKKYDVDVTELEAIALANLKRIPPKHQFEALEPGLWLMQFGDDYALERMLVPGVFDELKLDGDPVVFPVAADAMLAVGSNDVTAQEQALQIAAARMEKPRGLLDFAFVLTSGNWSVFLPEGGVGDALNFRVLMHLGAAYERQRYLLAKNLEREEDAPELGEFMVHGTLHISATRWRKGQTAWLPYTSVIDLEDAERRVPANWDDIVARVPGSLVKLPDLWPERFATKQFPPRAVFEVFQDAIADESRKDSVAPPRLRLVLAAIIVVALIVMYFVKR